MPVKNFQRLRAQQPAPTELGRGLPPLSKAQGDAILGSGYQNPGAGLEMGSPLPQPMPQVNGSQAVPMGAQPSLPGTYAILDAAQRDFRRLNDERNRQNLAEMDRWNYGPNGEVWWGGSNNNAGLAAKAAALTDQQWASLMGQAHEAEKLGLNRVMGVGELGLKQGRLGLDTQRAQTERDLGTGQLQIGQRAQQWNEHKIAQQMEEDKSGDSFLKGTLNNGSLTMEQKQDAIKQFYRQRKGGGGPSPVPGQPFPPLPSQQGLPSSPPGPGLLPDVSQQAQAGQGRNERGGGDQRGKLGKWELAFTPEIAADLKGAKNIQEAAQILDRKVAGQGITKEQGQNMMQYLKETYGDRAFRDYAQGTRLGHMAEFYGSALGAPLGYGRPSEDSEIASKFRNLAGLPSQAVPRWLPGTLWGPVGAVGAQAGVLARSLLGGQ